MGQLFVAVIMGTIIAGAVWMFGKFREGFAQHRLELAEDANRRKLCSRHGWSFRRTNVSNWSFWGLGFSVRTPESRWSISGASAVLGSWRLDFRSDGSIPLRFNSRGAAGGGVVQYALVHRSMRERESGRLMRGINAAVSALAPSAAAEQHLSAWDRLFAQGDVLPVARPQGYEWVGLDAAKLRLLHDDATLNADFAELVETLPGIYLMDEYNRRALSLVIAADGGVKIEGSSVSGGVDAAAVERLVGLAERAATIATGGVLTNRK